MGRTRTPSHIINSTDCTQTNCAIASTSRASVHVIVTEDDESAPRLHISTRQQTLTMANLTVSHGLIINIVSEATQCQRSPVDRHQRSQVVPNQRPPSTLVQGVPMPVNKFTNNDPSVGVPAATSNNSGSKNIWVFGSSIVYWAQRKASSKIGGQNLGLHYRGVEIRWFGKRGMSWYDSAATVEKEIKLLPPPSYLIIQLDSKDLGKGKSCGLIIDIKRDIGRTRLLLPNTRIIWSEILMMRYWHVAKGDEK